MCKSCVGHNKEARPVTIWPFAVAPADLQALMAPLYGSFLAELVAVLPNEIQIPNLMESLGHTVVITLPHPTMEGARVLLGGILIRPQNSVLWGKSKKHALASKCA